MGLEEALEEPAFWLLGGGAVIAELIGWAISKKALGFAFPFWQLAFLLLGTIVAAAFISLRD